MTGILPVLFEESAMSENMLGQGRCDWNITRAFREKYSEYDK